MALEIFGVQGIGILFTGFAAITVAFLIYLDPYIIDNIAIQLVYFFFATIGWAAVLWFPLKKMIRYDDDGNYSHIINTYATTHMAMKKNEIGEVVWSGTRMRAMIVDDDPEDMIPEKVTVKIMAVIDGVFYVTTNLRKEAEKK
jgi:hypothetical protein